LSGSEAECDCHFTRKCTNVKEFPMAEVSFSGKVAIVTGAGRGLGRAYARALAARGVSVVVNDYNVAVDGGPGDAEHPAEIVTAELRAAGANAVSNPDSIADPEGAGRIVQQAVDTFGRLDILINNAGIGMCDNIENEPGPLYDVNMNTTLLGTILMNRAAWPHLAEHRQGRIINVSSGAIFGSSWADGSVLGSYTYAKAGVFAETRQIARYGEQFGIKANAVFPMGLARTNAEGDGAMAEGEVGQFFRQHLPAEAVANGALFLVSDDCPVTGQGFSIGGGRVARVVFAEPPGFFTRDITPEKVRDNWAAVMGEVDEDDTLNGFLEVASLDREFQLVAASGVGGEQP
jgi:NAD(P)-dependent dehydrogenase (short-subunit alcohol dehydrogenase family)